MICIKKDKLYVIFSRERESLNNIIIYAKYIEKSLHEINKMYVPVFVFQAVEMYVNQRRRVDDSTFFVIENELKDIIIEEAEFVNNIEDLYENR